MNARSGLTLLEVTVSLVILGTMTAAALPLLLHAQRVLQAPPPVLEPWELAQVADQLLEDGREAGLERGVESLPWPGRPELGPIAVGWHPDGSGTWITFECGGLAVTRWRLDAQPGDRDGASGEGGDGEREDAG